MEMSRQLAERIVQTQRQGEDTKKNKDNIADFYQPGGLNTVYANMLNAIVSRY